MTGGTLTVRTTSNAQTVTLTVLQITAHKKPMLLGVVELDFAEMQMHGSGSFSLEGGDAPNAKVVLYWSVEPLEQQQSGVRGGPPNWGVRLTAEAVAHTARITDARFASGLGVGLAAAALLALLAHKVAPTRSGTSLPLA
jgi:hypothetical protein